MLYEYRIYELTPAGFDRYCELAVTELMAARGPECGTLQGFWVAESGRSWEVHHLWTYASLNDRQALRDELAVQPAWLSRFLHPAGPTIEQQRVRFMRLAKNSSFKASAAPHVEMRTYRCPLGKAAAVAASLLDKPRPPGCELMGVWSCDAPNPNEVLELLAWTAEAAALRPGLRSDGEIAWLRQQSQHLIGAESTRLSMLPVLPPR
jgi:hypothetical protein